MTSHTPPLVSIVTPSFNQGSFLAETIASVTTQDYPYIEYLVVDGGSTDGSVDLLRRSGDRVGWISETDRGQSDAINKGWRATRGEIIAWLNADDLYRPGAIGKVVAFFAKHPDVDLVYGDCDFINERGDVLGSYRKRPASSADLLRSPMSIIAQPATFLRRRVLETVGYLDERLHYIMDLDYWLRVAARHRIAHLPEFLAAFRVHGQSKSVRASACFDEERLYVYERFFNSPDLPQPLRRLKREVMSSVCCRIANAHFLGGAMVQARQYALMGWRHCPWRPQRAQLKVLILGLAGRRGARLAARLTALGHGDELSGSVPARR